MRRKHTKTVKAMNDFRTNQLARVVDDPMSRKTKVDDATRRLIEEALKKREQERLHTDGK